jgi:hypothetical protein
MNERLETEIAGHLAKHPDARNFLTAFEQLCHAVDDIIDNPDCAANKNFILDSFGLASDVYSCEFYRRNCAWLYPLIKNKHRIYSASVAWEKSDVQWKAVYADVLRCGGDNTLLMAVLEGVCHLSPDALRRLDALIREDAWLEHHDQEGKPI